MKISKINRLILLTMIGIIAAILLLIYLKDRKVRLYLDGIFEEIPSGEFMMGKDDDATHKNARPAHKVKMHSFFIMKKEVTKKEFSAFVHATGYKTDAEKIATEEMCETYSKETGEWQKIKGEDWRNPGFPQNDDHPVVCVSFNDAVAYSKWKTDSTNIIHRLPTEAEWEYAARSGSSSKFSFGDIEESLCDYGNVFDDAGDIFTKCFDQYQTTAPVGSFKPNNWNLYDMHGNVREWTQDCYAENYDYAKSNGEAYTYPNCGNLVTRGGGWHIFYYWAFSHARISNAPEKSSSTLGFRLVVE